MKQYLFLATAIATASLFTGCSNNEYVGDQPDALNGTDGAIVFSMGKANTTRAEGSSADEKLNKVFYVYGEKNAGTAESPDWKTVFDTYKVQYKATQSDKSASNTKGWEYVGITWDDKERQNVAGENAADITQTIKYWDYSACQYNFYAFSAKPDDVKGQNPKIKVERLTAAEGYTVTIKNDAHIEDLYFADKNVVNKANYVGGTNGKTTETGVVQLKFRNLASKVRVGFYETVPGYKIKIDKMYAGEDEDDAKFLAECKNTKALQDSKIKVEYITTEGETKNRAWVSDKKKADNDIFSEASELTATTNLTLGGGVFANPLETTSSSPTWDTNGGEYTFFWPQPTNDQPLKIKVDYTLTSVDKDDSNSADQPEEIHVTGATATVPADYVKWAANTAYTYIFKISKNTNGTTGGSSDPAGLYPITFDAAVVDMDEKTYLTTVSTPSVTVSQDGTNFVNPGGLKFKTGTSIELKVTDSATGNIIDGAQITGGYITVDYKYDKTPEQNLSENGGRIDNSVTLTQNKLDQQGTAGYWVLKVVKDSATTYVIIRVGNAEDGPETPVTP